MDISGKSYFEIFSLQENFDLNGDKLSAEYKKLQAQSHPDKFSGADDATRLRAVQESSIINDAFETLKSPLKRAAYLLSMKGINPEENNQNQLSEGLLLQQIDWRDQLESATDAEDMDTLDQLKQEVSTEQHGCIAEFRVAIGEENFHDAKVAYHKLQFIEKMLIEINRSEENILDY